MLERRRIAMRRLWINVVCLTILLTWTAASIGQPGPGLADPRPSWTPPKKPSAKSKLEEMLEQALQNNPDIRVAEAKVREAEAELSRTRLLVTQKVVALNAALDAARSTMHEAEVRFVRLKKLVETGAAPAEELAAAELTYQRFKAEMAKLESEAPYLTGRQPTVARDEAAVERGLEYLHKLQALDAARARAEQQLAMAQYAAAIAAAQKAWESDRPAAEKIRAALDKPITIEINKVSLATALAAITAKVPELPIHIRSGGVMNEQATASFKEVPVAVVLQWFEDVLPNHQAYVRDYGVLYIPAEQRAPSGAVPLREFWKAGKDVPGGRKGVDRIEGTITAADKDSPLIKISIGSDAGVTKGQVLDVYRTKPTPIYLGKVLVISVAEREAVAESVGKPKEPLKVGDTVATITEAPEKK
jgi:hypothetical protein